MGMEESGEVSICTLREKKRVIRRSQREIRSVC